MKEALVRATVSLSIIGLTAAAAAALIAGCRNTPPPRVIVRSRSGRNPHSTSQRDEVKPLPPSATQATQSAAPSGASSAAQDLRQMSRPAIGLAEIVPQQPTISQAYLDAYDRVG